MEFDAAVTDNKVKITILYSTIYYVLSIRSDLGNILHLEFRKTLNNVSTHNH